MWPFGPRRRRKPLTDSHALGARGEKLAKRFLKRLGLKILASNYRCPAGEVDLIAFCPKNDTILFVEVKTRNNDRHVAPESAVNADKQRRLRNIAKYYLATHSGLWSVRFDVISIVLRPDDKPDIRHIPDAFT